MKTPSLEKIISVAKSLRDDTRVPYAFEKRMMSRLQALNPHDAWNFWAPMMWRAAFAFVGIFLLTGAFVEFVDHPSTDLLANDLERTVLASVEVEDTW